MPQLALQVCCGRAAGPQWAEQCREQNGWHACGRLVVFWQPPAQPRGTIIPVRPPTPRTPVCPPTPAPCSTCKRRWHWRSRWAARCRTAAAPTSTSALPSPRSSGPRRWAACSALLCAAGSRAHSQCCTSQQCQLVCSWTLTNANLPLTPPRNHFPPRPAGAEPRGAGHHPAAARAVGAPHELPGTLPAGRCRCHLRCLRVMCFSRLRCALRMPVLLMSVLTRCLASCSPNVRPFAGRPVHVGAPAGGPRGCPHAAGLRQRAGHGVPQCGGGA